MDVLWYCATVVAWLSSVKSCAASVASESSWLAAALAPDGMGVPRSSFAKREK